MKLCSSVRKAYFSYVEESRVSGLAPSRPKQGHWGHMLVHVARQMPEVQLRITPAVGTSQLSPRRSASPATPPAPTPTGGEACPRVVGVGGGLVHLALAPRVARQVLAVLRIHGADLKVAAAEKQQEVVRKARKPRSLSQESGLRYMSWAPLDQKLKRVQTTETTETTTLPANMSLPKLGTGSCGRPVESFPGAALDRTSRSMPPSLMVGQMKNCAKRSRAPSRLSQLTSNCDATMCTTKGRGSRTEEVGRRSRRAGRLRAHLK